MRSMSKINDIPLPLRKFLNTKVPIVKKGQTIEQVSLLLKKQSNNFDTIDYVYIVDKNENLMGVFSTNDIFLLPKKSLVEKVMETKLITVSPNMEIEKIADLALKHSIKTIPVVHLGKLIGVVSPKNIAHILNKSLRSDLFHFAGIHKSHLEYGNSMDVPLYSSLKNRVPWLVIGLVGIIVVAAVIGVFEKTLEKNLILAFFMPAVVYVSSALGTQIQTLLIRDLAFMGKDFKISTHLLKQMTIAILISLIIGVLMFLAISFFWKQNYIAFVISLAAFISLIVTSFTAFMVTVILKKMGYDPALGGGPFATIVSDATSILIYFVVATLLL